MLPYRDSRITKIILGGFFLAILAYAFFEAQGLLFGPVITVAPGTEVVGQPFVTIRGKAEHIATLTMNGSAVSVTEQGVFEEPYVLQPGLNHIVFNATDKYGRKSRTAVEIVYQAEQMTVTAATSTGQ